MVWPFLIPFSWAIVLILSISQYERNTCKSPSVNHPCSWFTLCGVSSPSIFTFARSSVVHMRSTMCVFSSISWDKCTPLASFESDHRMIIQSFAVYFIWCVTFFCISWSSVLMACIKPFTAEYSACALCIAIKVSFFGSSGTPEECHIVW